jgi:SAM-dependent methyltransferase
LKEDCNAGLSTNHNKPLSSKRQVSPAEVMREIRNRVQRAYNASPHVTASGLASISTLNFDVRTKRKLRTNRILKPLVLKIREILEGEIQWYVDPIINRQVDFNSQVVAAIRNMNGFVGNVKLEVDNVNDVVRKLRNQTDSATTVSDRHDTLLKVLHDKVELVDSRVNEAVSQLVDVKKQATLLKVLHDKVELVDSRVNEAVSQLVDAEQLRKTWIFRLNPQDIAYDLNPPWTERFTEYLWVTRNLIERGRILDIGCVESILPQALARIRTLEVYGIDIRPYENAQFKFFQEDALHTHFSDDFFDQILAISSIEHFGLEWYGNRKLDSEADRKAMDEIKRILKPGGSALVTVPFGVGQGRFYRVYNERTLAGLLEGFRVEKTEFFALKDNVWLKSRPEEAGKSDGSEKVTAIACVKVIKPYRYRLKSARRSRGKR